MSGDSMIVTTLGTGYPRPHCGMAGPSTLVSIHVNSSKYIHVLFDCGRCTVAQLSRLGLLPSDIHFLVITHFHSDHITDMADFLVTRWLCKAEPERATIIGPPGVADVVSKCVTWLEDDLSRRHQHRGADTTPFESPLVIDAVPTSPLDLLTVLNPSFDTKGLKIELKSTFVSHGYVEEAMGYRIDVLGRDQSVVISGDTTLSDNLIALSRGANILVHEVLDEARLIRERGDKSKYIISYHSTPGQVAEVATRANVAHVVLTHIIPPVRSEEHEHALEAGLKTNGFTGGVLVGRDGRMVALSLENQITVTGPRNAFD